MPGLRTNSLDKIVEVYFAGVTAQPFPYNGKIFQPKEVHVSPMIFRGATCPMSCGGCCFKFTLVYLPSDPQPTGLAEVLEEVNGVKRPVFVDGQADNDGSKCRHLIKANGRCGIHGIHPFTCDFELIRFTHQDARVDIATRGFGRGWSYTRTTGQTGAICDILPASEKHKDDAVRKLTRLQEWTDYFGLVTHLPRIIEWVRTGPRDVPLHIVNGKSTRRSLFELAEGR